MYLLENSFVLGGLVTPQGDFSRVQSYRFVGWGTFVAFDPFL